MPSVRLATLATASWSSIASGGLTHFTAEYKRGGAGTAHFQASSIILQVY